MIYEQFVSEYKSFNINNTLYSSTKILNINPLKNSLSDIFTILGGHSFDKGLYRIHNLKSALFWNKIIFDYFPKYKDVSCCFGFDWLGRQYSFDTRENKNIIYRFDYSEGNVYEIEISLESFHNEELLLYKDEILLKNEFNLHLKRLNLTELFYNQCFTFKIPLFLGGKDELENYEVSDMEVSWEINNQIFKSIHNLK